jgi:plastocyanin domain-containing protein
VFALAAASCAGPAPKPEPAEAPTNAPPSVRTIEIRVSDSLGYVPAVIELTAGEPVRLAFKSEAKFDCMRAVVSEDLGIPFTPIPLGETRVVEIAPAKAGTYKFTCGMGMVSGTVVVRAS